MEENNKKPNYSKLSLISLLALLIQLFVAFILPKIIPNNNSILNIPWLVISIILAIVSRCKYKDKLSIFVLIIDFSIIFIIILATILFFNFLSSIMSGCTNLIIETDFINKMSACKQIG